MGPGAGLAQLVGAGSAIDLAHVGQAAERLGIDVNGLDRLERQAVRLLLERGRPLGVAALAARLGVDRESFEDVHEPWLERPGLIERTERGRVATERARALNGAEESVEVPGSRPSGGGATAGRRQFDELIPDFRGEA